MEQNLRNLSQRKRTRDEDENSNKRRCLRNGNEKFDFKKQCFYCNGTCIVDNKNTQIRTSLRKLEQRIPPFITKH